MELIDATTQLKTTHFKKFRKLVKPDDFVIAEFQKKGITLEATINTFRSFFQDKRVDCDDDDIVTFATEDAALVCSGLYYKKWCKPTWSICIFADERDTEKTSKPARTAPTKAQHDVGVSYVDEYENAKFFQGTASQATAWLNKNVNILTLRGFFKKQVVVQVDGSEWKTIDQLKDEGVLK